MGAEAGEKAAGARAIVDFSQCLLCRFQLFEHSTRNRSVYASEYFKHVTKLLGRQAELVELL